MIKPYKNLSLKNIHGELWKPIKGYKGLYEISNMGRVKSLERKGTKIGYGNYYRSPRIKKQNYGTNNYLCLVLNKDKTARTKSVHRLVAIHFIKNPKKKRCVNHKRGIRWDNRASQ